MKAVAVIGANYGDEGKGLTVDYLARQQAAKGQRPLIVRFNGGAQAGHTVVVGDKRHVFSHVGAGSYVPGARTYLSSQFIVNPYTLKKELVQLHKDGVAPVIYAHPQCMVTTIYDMAVNSLAELSRGAQRHGSCGMGVNETVTRCLGGSPLKLYHIQRLSVEQLANMLKQIVHKWVPERLASLGIGEDELGQHELYAAVLRAGDFERDAETLKSLIAPLIILDKVGLEALQRSIEPHQDIIMEGAQGLALDEHLGEFPYVTRSITGLPSAIAVAAYELEATEVEPLYITRSYLTRHGAGPLPHEGELITDKPLHDLTNIENMWQGALRKAPLNVQQLKGLIDADIARAALSSGVLSRGLTIRKAQVMLTCLDQLGSHVNIVNAAGATLSVPSAELPLVLARELGRDVAVTYCSYGPTADNVKSWI